MFEKTSYDCWSMGKGFQDKTCVYCGGVSSTADHVFARELIPMTARGNLPKVASCSPCNSRKATLEHYLATVLPFGGNHPANPEMLVNDVSRRLAKNQRLHRELAADMTKVRWIESGQEQSSIAIPMDTELLLKYLTFVARGLAAHHWNVVIPASYRVGANFVIPEQDQILRDLFVTDGSGYARGNIGDGLIMYEGRQGKNEPYLTLWRFLIFQGMRFGRDRGEILPLSPDIWAVSATTLMPDFVEA